ncbi:MAG: permease-like cell division protein FtsX, partial [Bacillota bacterium]
DFDRRWERTLVDKIEAISGVREVVFVSREMALDRLRDQFGSQADLLDAVEEDNPLRDSVEVTVVSSGDTSAVVRALSQLDSIEDVAYQREVVDKIYTLTEALRAAGMALVFVLGGVTFLLISNTVRLSIYARRKEIEVMRLVGASSGLIWGPLVVEGMLLGLIGAAVAGGVIAWGYIDLVTAVENSIPFVPLVGPRPLLENLMQLLVLCGVIIGVISSWFSVRRYARA